MRANGGGTVRIGQLVVAAFDEAARLSADPGEVAFLATRAVTRVLRRVPWRRGASRADGLVGESWRAAEKLDREERLLARNLFAIVDG